MEPHRHNFQHDGNCIRIQPFVIVKISSAKVRTRSVDKPTCALSAWFRRRDLLKSQPIDFS